MKKLQTYEIVLKSGVSRVVKAESLIEDIVKVTKNTKTNSELIMTRQEADGSMSFLASFSEIAFIRCLNGENVEK